MADSPLRAKGRAMRRKLMGDAYADKLDKGLYTDPFMEKFAEITQEAIFGTVWTRPGLDLKTRTLICVISDAATGRMPELKLHIRFARKFGAGLSKRCEARGEPAGGTIRPCRRSISCTVESAGGLTPSRSRQRAILRAPQAGCASRTFNTTASVVASLRAGLECGRRERSQSSRSPPAQRPSHL
jgi:4-carboxymuconolactone decarboxylase